MKAKLLSLLYLSSLFVANIEARSARAQKEPDQRERILATILDPQVPPDAGEVYRSRVVPRLVGEAYRSLFRLVGPNGLDSLLDHKNPGVAIQSAWELCRERAGKDPRGNVQRFLGFVEGRTHLKIPLRWEVEVLSESVSQIPRDRRKAALEPYFRVAPFIKRDTMFGVEVEPPPFKESALGVSVPGDVVVRREHGKILFSRGDASAVLSELSFETLHPSESFLNYCSIMFGSKQSYIILSDIAGSSFALAQINSESGTIRWRVKGWALNTGPATGYLYHWPTLVSTENQIAVFGVVSGSSYLEVYDRQSGRCCYRFATNLWYAPEK
jgi:hypothetical protein